MVGGERGDGRVKNRLGAKQFPKVEFHIDLIVHLKDASIVHCYLGLRDMHHNYKID